MFLTYLFVSRNCIHSVTSNNQSPCAYVYVCVLQISFKCRTRNKVLGVWLVGTLVRQTAPAFLSVCPRWMKKIKKYTFGVNICASHLLAVPNGALLGNEKRPGTFLTVYIRVRDKDRRNLVFQVSECRPPNGNKPRIKIVFKPII